LSQMEAGSCEGIHSTEVSGLSTLNGLIFETMLFDSSEKVLMLASAPSTLVLAERSVEAVLSAVNVAM
jgi:hypothetical protein